MYQDLIKSIANAKPRFAVDRIFCAIAGSQLRRCKESFTRPLTSTGFGILDGESISASPPRGMTRSNSPVSPASIAAFPTREIKMRTNVGSAPFSSSACRHSPLEAVGVAGFFPAF